SGAPHHQLIGTVDTGAARTDRSKHIVVAIFFVDIHTFEISAGHLLFFRTLFYRETILAHFNQVNATDASPHHEVPATIFNKAAVDGHVQTDVIAKQSRSMEGKGRGPITSCSYTNAAGPLATPYRHGVV